MCGRAFLLTNAGLQVLQFSGLLIDLLSILLRCNGFARIQKALVDQMGSRPPNSDHDLFLVQVWLWEVLWSFSLVQPLSWSSLQLRNGSLVFHRVREDNTAKWQLFVSSWGTHLSSFFTFPICFKCQMTTEFVDTEFFGNFSCSCKRISFDDSSQLSLVSTFDGQPLRSPSRLSSPLQNFLNHHCTVCSLEAPGPNTLLILHPPAMQETLLWFLSQENPLEKG